MENVIKFDDFINHFSLQMDGFKHLKKNNTLYIIGDENTLESTKEYINKMNDLMHIKVLEKYPLCIESIKYDNNNGYDIIFGSSDVKFNESILNENQDFIDLIHRILETINIKHLDILETIFNDIFYKVYHKILPDIKLVHLDKTSLKNKLDLTYIMGVGKNGDEKPNFNMDANSSISLIYIKNEFNWVSFSDLIGINELNDKNLIIFLSKNINK